MLSRTDPRTGKCIDASDSPGALAPLTTEQKHSLQMQVLMADGKRARAEYSEALRWIAELSGMEPARINVIIAQRVAGQNPDRSEP